MAVTVRIYTRQRIRVSSRRNAHSFTSRQPGSTRIDRLVDHVAPADPTKMKQTDLIAILKNLFRDKTSLTRRRIEILNYRYDKAISEHIDRINRLASDFERSKLTDDNFRVLLFLQSLCFSSNNENLKKRALRVIEKNENATLRDITTELEAHMNVSTNLKTLENPSNLSTSTTQSVRFKSEKKKRPSSKSMKQSCTTESVPRQSSNCNGCGGAHRRANCPFRDATCFKCSLKGHIAKVCRSKDKVDYLSADNTIDNTVDIDKPAIQSITSLNNYRRIYIPTSLLDQHVQFQYDSGSDVTTIGKDTWIRLGSPTLSSGKSVEHAGGNALKTLGRFKCKIRAANREGDVVIDVAARDGLNLFGLNAIEKLNL